MVRYPPGNPADTYEGGQDEKTHIILRKVELSLFLNRAIDFALHDLEEGAEITKSFVKVKLLL